VETDFRYDPFSLLNPWIVLQFAEEVFTSRLDPLQLRLESTDAYQVEPVPCERI
jgi:hypothetical protein